MKNRTHIAKLVSLLLTLALLSAMMTGCASKSATTKTETTKSASGSETTAAASSDTTTAAASAKKLKIAVLPKMKGENYWDACSTGAQEAIDELNKNGYPVDLLYDGPPQDQTSNQKQVDILEGWIAQGVDAIVIGCVDSAAIVPTLQKAMSKGIKVVTFDTDSSKDSRDFFVNQCAVNDIAKGLLDSASKELKQKGYGPGKPANLAIVAASKTESNHQAWLAAIKELLKTDEYSYMSIKNEDTDVYYPGSDETECQSQCATLISRMGEGSDKIQCAISFTSMGTPALGSAYESAANKPDKNTIVLTGLATPNALKSYIKNADDPLNTGVLWSCSDLGYLAVMTAYQLATGKIDKTATEIKTDRLGTSKIEDGGQVILGNVLIFDASSVDKYNY